jgi:sugar O-acyltransferase (sialic acid O-acetyltransferase NeuD family)
MKQTALYIYGAGGHGRVVADTAELSTQYEVLGLLDDDSERWGQRIGGLTVLGGRDALAFLEEGASIGLGIGSNRSRARVVGDLRRRGFRLATVVHPSAVIARGVVLGEGTYVAPLAVVHSDAVAGAACIVNTGAVVEHDCRLGDFAHVSPRAALGGGARIAEGAHVGLGAVLLPDTTLGPWATLGAGAVMVSSLPGGVTAAGVPARVLPQRRPALEIPR